jgi:transcriptional regulator with XRE-family HTH domain
VKDPQEKKFLLAFGKRLAELRKARGFTQSEFAEELDISRLSLAYFETGRRWPRPVTLQKLAKGLRVSVADLFKGM